jgi:hypothetical protein
MRIRTVSLPLLVLVAVGLGLAAAGPWRPGLVVAGAVLLVSGVLRLTLPAVRLGALVVRSRAIDTLTLVVAGGLLIGLAATFPTG